MADDITVLDAGGNPIILRTVEIGGKHYMAHALFDGEGNAIESLGGAVNVHPADVHIKPVAQRFYQPTGIIENLAIDSNKNEYTQTVASGASFTAEDSVKIKENSTTEPCFPVIKNIATNLLTYDRRLDNDYASATPATVEKVLVNLKTNVGSIASPEIFQVGPEAGEIWHITEIFVKIVHGAAADDGLFGSISALGNGLVIRENKGSGGTYRTFANWKSNGDMKSTAGAPNVIYTDKAGGGKFGTGVVWSLLDSEVISRLDGSNGDIIETLVQDDLTALTTLELAIHGHIEGV